MYINDITDLNFVNTKINHIGTFKSRDDFKSERNINNIKHNSCNHYMPVTHKNNVIEVDEIISNTNKKYISFKQFYDYYKINYRGEIITKNHVSYSNSEVLFLDEYELYNIYKIMKENIN